MFVLLLIPYLNEEKRRTLLCFKLDIGTFSLIIKINLLTNINL